MSFPITTISMTSSVVFGTYRNCLQCLSQARGAGCGPNTKPEVFLSGLAGGVVQVRDVVSQMLRKLLNYVPAILNLMDANVIFNGQNLKGIISTIEPLLVLLPQTSVMSPGDIVKVRLQCQTESKWKGNNVPKPKYRGPMHCLLSIIKEEGVMGLYRGAVPLMLRDGPSYAMYFLTYTTICDQLRDSGEKRPSE